MTVNLDPIELGKLYGSEERLIAFINPGITRMFDKTTLTEDRDGRPQRAVVFIVLILLAAVVGYVVYWISSLFNFRGGIGW